MTDMIEEIAQAIASSFNYDHRRDDVVAAARTVIALLSPSRVREDALEEAAKVAESHRDERSNRAALIAAAIRALKGQPSPAQGAAEGWKLVPVEPTEAMIRALDAMLHDHWPNARKMAVAAHAAMLAAAPEPHTSAKRAIQE